jgi:microcystin-dependent protein
MAADFNKPTVTDAYTLVPGQIRDNQAAAVTMHETDASANKPTGAKRLCDQGEVSRWASDAWNPMGSLVPTGVVMAWAHPTNTTPGGTVGDRFLWLQCAGQLISRETYSALFAVIGVTYGAGDGVTTFAVPNLVGRVIVHPDSAPIGGVGSTGGANTHTLTTAEMPAHAHGGTTGTQSANHTHGFTTSGASDGSHTHTLYSDIGGDSGTQMIRPDAWTAGTQFDITGGDHSHSGTTAGISADHAHEFTTGSAGSGGAHANLQPFLAMRYIIKT